MKKYEIATYSRTGYAVITIFYNMYDDAPSFKALRAIAEGKPAKCQQIILRNNLVITVHYLHLACIIGSTHLVEWFLTRGIQPDYYSMAVAASGGYAQIVDILVAHQVYTRDQLVAAADWAYINGHDNILQSLRSPGLNAAKQQPYHIKCGVQHPSFYVARIHNGNTECTHYHPPTLHT